MLDRVKVFTYEALMIKVARCVRVQRRKNIERSCGFAADFYRLKPIYDATVMALLCVVIEKVKTRETQHFFVKALALFKACITIRNVIKYFAASRAGGQPSQEQCQVDGVHLTLHLS